MSRALRWQNLNEQPAFAETDEDPIDNDDLAPNEISVDPRLREPEDKDIGPWFGLALATTLALIRCRNSLILTLLRAMIAGYDGIFYSRNRNTYSQQTALPRHWTFANVLKAVASLAAAPMFFVHKLQPQQKPTSGTPNRRSSFSPGPALLAFDATQLLCGIPIRPTERIEVRDPRRRPKPNKQTPETQATEKFLARCDAAFDSIDITIDHPSARLISPGTYLVQGKKGPTRIDLRRRTLVRIFNGTQKSGGRFYGAFWESMPKSLRPFLRINGASVVEHDFECCHVRLLYSAADLSWPFCTIVEGDAYDLPNQNVYVRNQIKRATNSLWNTRSVREAEGAIAKLLPGSDIDANRPAAQELIRAIKSKHPGLMGFFHCNQGKALQFVDSQILNAVS